MAIKINGNTVIDDSQNITSTGTVSATGNVTGGNLTATGSIYAATIVGNIQGNLTAPGSNTQVIFNDNSQAAATSGFTFNKTSNAVTVSGNIYGGNLSVSGNIIGNFNLDQGVSASGNITGGNVLTAGLVSATGTITGANITGANILTAGQVSAGANITGGNVLTAGIVSSTGNATHGNIATAGQVSATGNVTGNYLLGNAYYVSGLSPTQIYNGTSNVSIPSVNGNISFNVGSENWLFDSAGNITVPANTWIQTPVGSNGSIEFHPDGTGQIVIKGNAVSNTASSTGALLFLQSDYANAQNRIEIDTFGNNGALGGTVVGRFARGTADTPQAVQYLDNLAAFKGKGYNGSAFTNPAAQVVLGVAGNWTPTSTPTSIEFDVTPVNSTTMAPVARIYSYGDYQQLVGNILVNNGQMSASGNVTGGNISTAGLLTGGNIATAGTVSATANITAGNVLTAGQVSSTGNATHGNISTAGSITGSSASVTGNVTGASLFGTIATAAQTGITTVGTLATLAVSGNTTTNGLTVTANATIGNLYVSGNTTIAGNITQISGNSGQFFGNATTGFNALYAGLPAGFSILPDSVVNFVGSANNFSQINNQNQSGGSLGTADYVITGNNGDNDNYFLDLGYAGSGYDGTVGILSNSMGNSVGPNDGYLYVHGNTSGNHPSNFVLATPDANSQIKMAVGGSMASNISVTVNPPSTSSTNGTSGTLIVTGGIGASGNIYATGNISGGNVVGTTVSVSGGVTAASVAGGVITGTSASVSGGVTAASVSGGVISGSSASLTGNIVSGNISATNHTGTAVSVTGNINGGNLLIAAGISTGGNITGGNISVTNFLGTAVSVTGGVTAASVSGGVITGSSASLSGGVTAASVSGGVITGSSASLSGTVTGGNVNTGGTISAAGNATVGNVSATNYTGTTVSVTGSITGGNITGGNILTTGNVSATGNIQGNYFIGNGSQLTGIGASGAKWTASSTAPSSPNPGDFWYATTSNVKYQYYNDGTGNSWVDQSAPLTYTSLAVTGNLSVGNVTNSGFETVTGNITGGNLITAGTLTVNSAGAATAIVNGAGNTVGNIGSASGWFNTLYATSSKALYADLAENYQADTEYNTGTVVEFGGAFEITQTTQSHSTRIAGVVSSNPSYLMNAGLEGTNVLPVALTGRLQCRVVGKINKGDRLVSSSLPGVAQALDPSQYEPGSIFGKALEDYDSSEIGTIEIAVGRY
jgi:fibronectin-binding autotransporter adhesin